MAYHQLNISVFFDEKGKEGQFHPLALNSSAQSPQFNRGGRNVPPLLN